ncbi:MAG: hypothetical protein OXF42_02205 [Candidatus Dadabacteria bacterium]|nr:hypothetical protein [Candidatus Dadabacteria bacterium]
MDDKEQVIRHLEMIQGVINRLSHNSFLIKGWSVTILSAGIIFIVRSEIQNGWFILAFIVLIIGSWSLDGYFLWQERLLRGVYNNVRKRESTDFSMDTKEQKSRPGKKMLKVMFRYSLVLFYLMQLAFVLAVFILLNKI